MRGITNPRFMPLLAAVFDRARSEENALAQRALWVRIPPSPPTYKINDLTDNLVTLETAIRDTLFVVPLRPALRGFGRMSATVRKQLKQRVPQMTRRAVSGRCN
jgi:hypothetical protein